jgi:imidazolonepropionase-like amidohydrolase
MRYVAWALAALVVLLAAAVSLLFVWPMRDPRPPPRQGHGVLAVRDVAVLTSPDAPRLERATVLVEDGIITAVQPDLAVPAGARVLGCAGCTLVAGLWNAHVHFTEPKWSFAAYRGANVLDLQLADMTTSRGFTTVVDVGSDPRDTLSLRRRIERGELRGPAIYTSGPSFYPPDGIPYYVRQAVPAFVLWLMPKPRTPAEVTSQVDSNARHGADLVKLFTGSYVARGQVLPMPVELARAAVTAAHRLGQPVWSHASSLAGAEVALESGVDVLAHALDNPEGVDDHLLALVVARHMAMVPTLSMFAHTVTTDESYLGPIRTQVRRFHELGGQLLFGTDVGYDARYDTRDELTALAACGLSSRDVLRMLTTAPAARLGATHKGTIAPGQVADLVLLDGDPDADVTALARVRVTVRAGEVVYERR